MVWPINVKPLLPKVGSSGDFGYARSWYYHSGIDLYCPVGTTVRAIEDGEVVAVEHFTGPQTDSPRWNNTWAVLVHGASGTLVYGEMWPEVRPYDKVKSGDLLGHVLAVLKRDKGNGLAMLHFERYNCLVHQTADWRHNEDPPSGLVNPRPLLESLIHV